MVLLALVLKPRHPLRSEVLRIHVQPQLLQTVQLLHSCLGRFKTISRLSHPPIKNFSTNGL